MEKNKELLPYSHLTNEELLAHVYHTKGLRNGLELELAARLEREMDGVGEDVGRDLGTLLEDMDGSHS